jgi:hypothetical protein
MKFKNKLILMNVLVAVLITLFIGCCRCAASIFISLQNRVEKLSVNANEASVLISQSIRSTQVIGDNYDFYASNAAFLRTNCPGSIRLTR